VAADEDNVGDSSQGEGVCGARGSDDGVECPITEARDHLADLVNRAAYAGETVYLTRRGRRMAAIVPVDRAGRPALDGRADASQQPAGRAR